MKSWIAAVLVLLTANLAHAEAEGDNEGLEAMAQYMVTAKMTGMCGVFYQMGAFQESTQMDGGTEFITRFVNTEAARLGHSVESLMAGCKSVTENYNALMSALTIEN